MEKMRKPFQGVFNIVRFNWHFYVAGFFLVLLLALIAGYVDESLQVFIYILCVLIFGLTVISLAVSFYVYDLSGLYDLNWTGQPDAEHVIVNINAGFDETSAILNNKFKNAQLIVLDFYDPLKHTEISIKRARKAYPPFPETKQIVTTNLELSDNSVDKLFVILSAHEIRNEVEKATFFKELKRVIKPTGQIYVTEHLRDLSNFLAYTVGFFHFYSKSSWLKTFHIAELAIKQELKLTPFISTFILGKNGNTL